MAVSGCRVILRYLARKYPRAGRGDNGTLEGGVELNRRLALWAGDFRPVFVSLFVPERFTAKEGKESIQAVKEVVYIGGH